MERQRQGSTDDAEKSTPKGFVMIERSLQRDTQLSFEARSLAQLIAGFEGQDGKSWPGVAKLKELTGWGPRTIMRYRTELRRAGRLKRRRHRQPSGTFYGSEKYQTVGVLHPPDPARAKGKG